MSFKSWNEYLDERGKMVEKPEVDKVADYDGKTPVAPEKVKPLKNPDGKEQAGKQVGTPAPYAPANNKQKNPNKTTTGMADEGDKKLIYKPKIDQDTADAAKGTVVSNYPNKTGKSKTENFLDATAGMNMAEFTKYMVEECGCGSVDSEALPTVTAFKVGKFQPFPPEVIRYLAALAKDNDQVLENLIFELKRNGVFEKLVGQSMDHPEFYDHVVKLMGDDEDGESRSRSLVGAMDDHYQDFKKSQEDMYESVAPPFGDNEENDGEDKEQDDEGQPKDDQPNPAEDDQPSPDDMDDDKGPTMDGFGDDKAKDDDQSEVKPERKLKKKFPHHHVIDAMQDYDHMRDHMKGQLS